MKTRFLILFLGLLISGAAHAEWRTETYTLKPGWNAIYPTVDASHVDIDTLLENYSTVLEIWRWQPERVDPRLPGDVNAVPTGVEWSTWKRGHDDETTFTRLSANYGYLVRLDDASPQITLSIKGRAALPEVRWRGDALQLVGFPVLSSGTTPTFTSYVVPTGFALGSSASYRYIGGPISTSNPAQFAPTSTRIVRGQAYWIRVNQFSRYYGPLKVELTGGDKIGFGTSSGTQSMLLTNQTSSTITYTLGVENSEAAPSPQPVVRDPVPLMIKVNADPAFTALTTPRTLTLAPGAITRVQVTLDRAAMSGSLGYHFASMIKLTTTAGLAGEEVYVPVTAELGSMAGLWIGEAQIDQVASVAKRYKRDQNGNTIYDTRLTINGSTNPNFGKAEILEDITTPGGSTIFPGVKRTYPLRVMLHVQANGTTTLLSHIYQGTLDTGLPNPPLALVTDESRLDPATLRDAVRLSVAHLPLDTAKVLTGSFAIGTTLNNTASPIATDYNSAINPFVHTYHPDHDNLDSRFTQTPLSQGKESFNIERSITLQFDAAAPSDAGSEWGTTLMTGAYSEDITGPYKDAIRVRGSLRLSKVSDIPVITP